MTAARVESTGFADVVPVELRPGRIVTPQRMHVSVGCPDRATALAILTSRFTWKPVGPGPSGMRDWLIVCILLLAPAAQGHAQTRGQVPPAASPVTRASPPPPAVVEGDVYLRMQDGEIRKMAAGRVYLIPHGNTNALAPLCAVRDSSRSEYVRLRRPIRLAYDSARNARGRMRSRWRARADSAATTAAVALQPGKEAESAVLAWLNEQRSAQTGMAAHYSFDSVTPGEYALYSDTELAYFWFAPIRAAPGRQVRDLDNNNMSRVVVDKTSSIAWEACEFSRRPPGWDAARRTEQQIPVLLNRDEVQAEVRLRYPPGLVTVGGTVWVRFRILQDGSVDRETVEAVNASVPESVRAEAEAAAEMASEHMRFSPATVDGRPVRVWVTQPIHFG